MKRIFIVFLCCCFMQSLGAQVTYYNVEWRMKNKQDLFTGVCKIELKNNTDIKGEIAWVFLAVDSTDKSMMDIYEGKKGKCGIEKVEGSYTAETHDVYFEGVDKDDPSLILGLDKYSLKLSADKQVLYGTSATGGTNNGMFYAIKLNNAEGIRKFALAKARLSKK